MDESVDRLIGRSMNVEISESVDRWIDISLDL